MYRGWAPDDFSRNVQGFLAGKEEEYFTGVDFQSHGFGWIQADKPHKFGWDIIDYQAEERERYPFSVSLSGEVYHYWDHHTIGQITDEGVLKRMREYADNFVRPKLF